MIEVRKSHNHEAAEIRNRIRLPGAFAGAFLIAALFTEQPAQADQGIGDGEEVPLDDLDLGTDSGASDAGAADAGLIDMSELSLEEMLEEPVVSTAGKRAQKQSRSVAATSILTKDEIKAFPTLYAGELLSMLPAMDVRWGQMQRLFVGIRGLGGTGLNARTLVLVDGVPMNDPITGDAALGHFFPTVDIERIEVIRGPGSSLYGANAFSGVVNVITATPEGEKFSDRLSASNLFGSNLTERLQASYGQKVGPVKVGVGVEALRTDGPFPVLQKEDGDRVISIDNDGVESVAVSGQATYRGLRVAARYVDGERGRPGQFPVDEQGRIVPCGNCHTHDSPAGAGRKYPTVSDTCGGCHIQPHDREQIQRGTFAASYDRQIGDVKMTAIAFHNEWRTEYQIDRETAFLNTPVQEAYQLKQRSSGIEIHGVHTQGDNEFNTVLVGAEVRRNEAASDLLRLPDGSDRKTEVQASLFAEDELRPLKWMSLVAGARFDHNTLHGEALSPRGGVIVTPWKNGAVRVAGGRAFRNPVLGELYVDDNKGPTHRQGNPDLEPEWINTVETGVVHTFPWWVTLRAAGSAFYSFSNNLIGVRSSGFPTPEATFYNIDHAHIWGGELEMSAESPDGPASGRAFASYSYQRTEDGDGQILPYAPKSKVSLGVMRPVGRFATSARAQYRGRRLDSRDITLPSVTTVDLSAGADLGQGFHLKLWAANVFDVVYQESLGIPGARRSLFVILGYDGTAGGEE